MEFLEKDLEDIIYDAENFELEYKGLPIDGKKYRQLRIGNYGIADIVTVEKRYRDLKESDDKILPYLYITVYELKRSEINESTFFQALTYIRGIQRYLDYVRFKHDCEFNMVLIGKTLNKKSRACYLRGIVDNCDIYTYKYSFDGIEFNLETNYHLTNEGF